MLLSLHLKAKKYNYFFHMANISQYTDGSICNSLLQTKILVFMLQKHICKRIYRLILISMYVSLQRDKLVCLLMKKCCWVVFVATEWRLISSRGITEMRRRNFPCVQVEHLKASPRRRSMDFYNDNPNFPTINTIACGVTRRKDPVSLSTS